MRTRDKVGARHILARRRRETSAALVKYLSNRAFHS